MVLKKPKKKVTIIFLSLKSLKNKLRRAAIFLLKIIFTLLFFSFFFFQMVVEMPVAADVAARLSDLNSVEGVAEYIESIRIDVANKLKHTTTHKVMVNPIKKRSLHVTVMAMEKIKVELESKGYSVDIDISWQWFNIYVPII